MSDKLNFWKILELNRKKLLIVNWDVMALFPTGFAQSVVFQLFSHVANFHKKYYLNDYLSCKGK